jgi:hypothetical protein
MLGVSENPDRIPEHERKENRHIQFNYTDDTKGDKESPKHCSSLKSCESIYTCPRAPFIGRRRDFYILKTPVGPKEYS